MKFLSARPKSHLSEPTLHIGLDIHEKNMSSEKGGFESESVVIRKKDWKQVSSYVWDSIWDFCSLPVVDRMHVFKKSDDDVLVRQQRISYTKNLQKNSTILEITFFFVRSLGNVFMLCIAAILTIS